MNLMALMMIAIMVMMGMMIILAISAAQMSCSMTITLFHPRILSFSREIPNSTARTQQSNFVIVPGLYPHKTFRSHPPKSVYALGAQQYA